MIQSRKKRKYEEDSKYLPQHADACWRESLPKWNAGTGECQEKCRGFGPVFCCLVL
jgi:hypothetical protein